MTDPNEVNSAGAQSSRHSTGDGGNSGATERPYGDAGSLYDIPRVRSDDPPMRPWWTDDEAPESGS